MGPYCPWIRYYFCLNTTVPHQSLLRHIPPHRIILFDTSFVFPLILVSHCRNCYLSYVFLIFSVANYEAVKKWRRLWKIKSTRSSSAVIFSCLTFHDGVGPYCPWIRYYFCLNTTVPHQSLLRHIPPHRIILFDTSFVFPLILVSHCRNCYLSHVQIKGSDI